MVWQDVEAGVGGSDVLRSGAGFVSEDVAGYKKKPWLACENTADIVGMSKSYDAKIISARLDFSRTK